MSFSLSGGPGPQWPLGPSGAHVVPYPRHHCMMAPMTENIERHGCELDPDRASILDPVGANWIWIGRRYWIREGGELWLMGVWRVSHVGVKSSYRDGRYQGFPGMGFVEGLAISGENLNEIWGERC